MDFRGWIQRTAAANAGSSEQCTGDGKKSYEIHRGLSVVGVTVSRIF